MKSSDIISILCKKHKKEIYLKEVSTGRPWQQGTFRIDFWAIKLDWYKTDTSAYEIKVSRQDFLNDVKWHNYLPYCNKFYFACPVGVIKKEELPPKIGLLYVNEDGGFKVIKAAVYRNVQIPVEIYKYLLMHRFKKETEVFPSREELIRQYTESKINSISLGNEFKNKLLDELNKTKYINEQITRKLDYWKDVINNYTPRQVIEAINKKSVDIDISTLETISILSTRELNRIKSVRERQADV